MYDLGVDRNLILGELEGTLLPFSDTQEGSDIVPVEVAETPAVPLFLCFTFQLSAHQDREYRGPIVVGFMMAVRRVQEHKSLVLLESVVRPFGTGTIKQDLRHQIVS